jgi:hypothetical protein
MILSAEFSGKMTKDDRGGEKNPPSMITRIGGSGGGASQALVRDGKEPA